MHRRLPSQTSNTTDLAANASAVVLEGRAECDGWRTFVLSASAPVNAVLEWGSELGAAEPATFSVARGSKVCVRASWWRLSVANQNGADSVRVRVGRLDAQVDVEPVFEEHAVAAPSPSPETHTPPNWAHDLRVDTTGQALPGSLVELLDAGGTVRAAVTQIRQPLWIPLGLAQTVRVTSDAPYRLVWRLRLL